ncbi:hypothetical protein ACIGH6_14290 [Brachybacterium paraconglomeratum]|uniref:hypothetical protein n=1 Tax=Brachybacterium paraconglomeratum TaxID=173362 RepID=UPI0037CB2FCB
MTSFELIGTMRDRLEDIRHWRSDLSDVMLTVSGYSMDLTGIRGTTDRIPGGDALAMLAPWAPDATHGDDLPHPDQILREWRETITEEQHGGSWAECWRWHWDHTPTILESPWAEGWQQDLTALWWRLARLTGNAPKQDTPTMADAEEIQRHAQAVPDHTMLTLREADRFAPGIENRVKRDRNAERDRARRQHREPAYRCDPDGKHWHVADLRRHYGFPVLASAPAIV